MKKHKQQKPKERTQETSVKRGFFSRSVRNIGFTILLVGLFFSSMYGFKCFATKVCDSVVVDKMVRSDAIVLMPKGALEVEVANTRGSRELGLSGRDKMGDNEGFLYVFDAPGRYGFWMKDMSFPLDIIWINQNGVVVDIERDVATTSDPNPKIFMNESEAVYVLEINAGLSQRFGLYLGTKVKITD